MSISAALLKNNEVGQPLDQHNQNADEQDLEKILYHITHDLRSALRSMTTLPAWIKEDIEKDGQTVGEETARFLDMIERNARRADDMLLSIRDYSRIGRKSKPAELLDLEVVLQKAIKLAAIPGDVETSLKLDKCSIEAPQVEIEGLFRHVIENAWRFNKNQDRRIEIECRVLNETLHMSVVDNGPGIEQKYRDRVFDLMFTLISRDDGAGHGIGLSYSKKAVEHLGGEIGISDGPNSVGTCFWIKLPLSQGGKSL